ncbi:hypothetical protein QBC46DRAFT_97529 [Diplogelasinospora grovesii]|uniref:Mating-type switching protein swi10 n=1 Tax=Diplogelasinospora grovesii TaxID=303347 RepID=A0AAN6N9F4_9PEZI|nr:hypothetical protein QBC46DRAFT_97529 [Diplogelasinospora grovesii]
MELGRGRSLAPDFHVKTKASSVPKLRKKLQKRDVSKQQQQQRNQAVTKRPASETNKSDTENKPSPAQAAHSRQQSSLPPPDLSDAKWNEYLRRSGYLDSVPRDSLTAQKQSQPSTKEQQPHNSISSPVIQPAVNLIPELSHLALSDARSCPTSTQVSPTSDTFSAPATTTMSRRRRAKTPIFSIGQLEDIPRPGNALMNLGEERDDKDQHKSVELIAEQYRALIESRHNSICFTDSHSAPASPRRPGSLEVRRQHSSEDLRERARRSIVMLPNADGSPTRTRSDDGTLVAFEEETVYFKPVSFSPEPGSPTSRHENERRRFPSPPPQPDNLSLQICLDLLTKDLASAMTNSGRANSDTTSAALEVWVMIEAYERLRDKMLSESESRLPFYYEQRRPVEMMFDMWLRALYTIHDALTGYDGRATESDYGDILQSEELD